VTVAQRIVELVIGRLITDEQFRTNFLNDPTGTLEALHSRGFELTRIEIAALIDTTPDVWLDAAAGLDRRLQKASLSNPPASSQESEHHV
jgi:hypothetical protein